MKTFFPLFFLVLFFSGCGWFSSEKNNIVKVYAKMQTVSVGDSGDSLDDPCFFINPKDSSKSLIIGTDKSKKFGGLRVYNISGKEVQHIKDGRMNNVDIRYNFTLNKNKIAIVTTSNRSNNSIAIYKYDSKLIL